MGAKNELIENGENGIIVPIGNEVTLANALQDLVTNPKKRSHLSSNALKVREHYAFSKISKQYLDFLENAC